MMPRFIVLQLLVAIAMFTSAVVAQTPITPVATAKPAENGCTLNCDFPVVEILIMIAKKHKIGMYIHEEVKETVYLAEDVFEGKSAEESLQIVARNAGLKITRGKDGFYYVTLAPK
jgi:hypothetical protein